MCLHIIIYLGMCFQPKCSQLRSHNCRSLLCWNIHYLPVDDSHAEPLHIHQYLSKKKKSRVTSSWTKQVLLWQLKLTITSVIITCQAIARITRASVAPNSVCTCLSTASSAFRTFVNICIVYACICMDNRVIIRVLESAYMHAWIILERLFSYAVTVVLETYHHKFVGR